MSISREVVADGWRVHLDIAGQVLRLDVPEFVIGCVGHAVGGKGRDDYPVARLWAVVLLTVLRNSSAHPRPSCAVAQALN